MVTKKFPVFMDLRLHGPRYLRMTFELFHDLAPFTAENFRGLCTGEKGFSPKFMRPLWFNGRFFYLRKGCSYVKGGVFCCETGEGGESLMGSHLPAESSNLKHDRAGLLSTRRGDGSNFLVTLEADQSLDSSHVVFGKVVEGFGTLLLMKDYGVEGAKIVDSGELYNAELPKHVVVTRYLSHAVDKDQGSVSRPVIHNTSSQSASKDTGRRPARGKMKKGKVSVGEQRPLQVSVGEQRPLQVSVREQRPLLVYFRKKRMVHG